MTAADKTYDGTTTESDANMSCSLTGVLAADSANVSCAATSGTFDSKDVATASQVTATVTISGTAAGNYTLGAAGTTTPSTSTIAPAHITTKAITATLTAADKTYDGNTAEPDASMNCSLSGVLAGDSANVNCTASSGSFNTSQVLTANQVTATMTISGTGAGNYTLGTAGTTTSSTSAMATAHITTKAITATLTAADKIYDGTTTEPNAMSCSLTGVLGADSANVSCAASSGTFNTSARSDGDSGDSDGDDQRNCSQQLHTGCGGDNHTVNQRDSNGAHHNQANYRDTGRGTKQSVRDNARSGADLHRGWQRTSYGRHDGQCVHRSLGTRGGPRTLATT